MKCCEISICQGLNASIQKRNPQNHNHSQFLNPYTGYYRIPSSIALYRPRYPASQPSPHEGATSDFDRVPMCSDVFRCVPHRSFLAHDMRSKAPKESQGHMIQDDSWMCKT